MRFSEVTEEEALIEDLLEARKHLKMYVNEGDNRSARDCRDIIKDLEADIAVIRGADESTVEWSTPAQTGIHSGDIRYRLP